MSYFVASEGALEAGAAVVARKRSISRFAALTLAALSRRLLGTSSMVALGLVLATSTPSRATDWTGGTSTDWFTATNWSAGVPTSAGTAKIDTVAPNATVVGATGAQANTVIVGYSDTGTLTIQNGGTVSSGLGYLGLFAGSTGTATVDGAGSAWTNSGLFIVGQAGTGTLTIQNGGAVSSATGYLGAFAGSTGTATVDGAGSAWTNSGNLVVGNSGTGTLTIRNGGTVSNAGTGYLGGASTGTATVDGAGSAWTSSSLIVGFDDTGTLTIQNGGAVSNVTGHLGVNGGSTGTVTVDGAGSSWTNSGDLVVGSFGTGTLTIRNGGAGSNVIGILGANAGSTGTMTVDGAGSSWSSSGLYVGNSGAGTLTIRNGGTMSNAGFGYLGFNAGSTGTATVDGAGSTWTNSGDLKVGNSGTGTLTIQNGGAVSNAVGFLGSLAGSTGTATVDGAGSAWTNSGNLVVGNSGAGTLTIRNGGTVSNVIGDLGNNAGSTGTVTVDGAGSSWSSGALYVGDSGAGTLTIRNGGAVSNATIGHLGFNAGSTGTVTVDGAGSSWTNSGLVVGFRGTGTLTIQNGGAVSNVGNGFLGYNGGSTGTATVDGAGSTWTNSFNLFVGYLGTGMLTIANGGTVSTASGMQIAAFAGSTGTLNIGAASGQAATAPGTLTTPSVAFGAGTGSIVFNHTASNYNFAPVISGAGSVTVENGTTILTATNTYSGATTVNGGTLAVNGSIANSAVTVNAGGTLGGNGTVGNTTINGGGVLAPGNSIGTLTVGGNLAFSTGGLYRVEVSASADRTNVTGAATLTGATVQTVFQPGSYVSKNYTILSAAGGLGGTSFGGVSGLPNFNAGLSYTLSDVLLNLTASLGAGTSLPGNPQTVASTLNNFFNNGGALPPGFVALFGLTGSNLSAALSQTSGETATGSQQTTFNAMNQFMGLLTDPFIDGRGDGVSAGSSAGASAYASPDRSRSGAARDANAMFTKAPVMADPFAQRWSVWAAGYGGSQTTDGNTTLGSNNTTSRIAGIAVGADYRISPNTLAGFALAGGGTTFSTVNGGSGRSDMFQAGAFVRHNAGAAYLSGALAYGWQDITTNRTVTVAGIDQLRAQFNANAFSGRVEGGYRFVSPWMGGIGITPYAAGQFTTFDLPAYAEQAVSGVNTFALAYASKSVTDTRSELGLRSDKSYAMPDGIFTLRGRLAWAHDFNPGRNIGATFQTLPGASFVVGGAAQASDSALVTASAEKKWLNGWSAAATFEGEFSQLTKSYAGKGVVRYAW
ncbi:autotransporter domain-containing protein [Bradyrhizobium sp. RT4b]|uniref:autotransporter outer membrane beta-barrel domain-containing protein n=1 Tax=unclassified Bradyrhizobium TaxID=2631580 RepID=UPI00339B3702